jgi:hypothetical protein
VSFSRMASPSLLQARSHPVAARAQQSDRVRRIGVLMQVDEHDPEGKNLNLATILATICQTGGSAIRSWALAGSPPVGGTLTRWNGSQPRCTVKNGLPLNDLHVCSRQLRTWSQSGWGPSPLKSSGTEAG